MTQLNLWNPIASVDAYGKGVCYDGLIAENVKHGSLKNERPCEVQILTRSTVGHVPLVGREIRCPFTGGECPIDLNRSLNMKGGGADA